jgi:uncharacterized protein YpmB
VLMPPQQNQPPALPNANPEYNFIFNGQQQSKKRFSLPGGNNFVKIAFLIVGVGFIVGILIIVASSFFGPKINTKQVTDVIARGVEITRVSDEVTQKSRDLNTANLASTTSATLSSEDNQLLSYLNKNKKKVNKKDLSLYVSKNTVAEIVSADQNNRLSEYYNSYLKKNLTDYLTAIKTAYDSTNGPTLKADLLQFSNSTKTILSTQQLATTQP